MEPPPELQPGELHIFSSSSHSDEELMDHAISDEAEYKIGFTIKMECEGEYSLSIDHRLILEAGDHIFYPVPKVTVTLLKDKSKLVYKCSKTFRMKRGDRVKLRLGYGEQVDLSSKFNPENPWAPITFHCASDFKITKIDLSIRK